MDFHSFLLYVYWTYWRAPTKSAQHFGRTMCRLPVTSWFQKTSQTTNKKTLNVGSKFRYELCRHQLKSSLGKVTKKWLKVSSQQKMLVKYGEITCP